VHGRRRETVENVNFPEDPLDVAKMSREQRQALKREILRQHPQLVDEYRRMAGIDKAKGVI
jgi:hypothetical protein